MFSEKQLLLPIRLSGAYVDELTARGLIDAAKQKAPENVIGGKSKEDSELHFTYRFCASAIRGECAVIDPESSLGKIPADLLATFQDGKISCLDVAAGTGGGILGILMCIYQLRALGLVATLPLDIHVYAGDISPHALDIYESMFGRLAPTLNEVGIWITVQRFDWDITAADQVSNVVDKWFSFDPKAEEHVVLVSALSGGKKELLDPSLRTFQHIGERLATRSSTLLWIEPQMSSVPRLIGWVIEKLGLSWFRPVEGTGHGYQYRWQHPITKIDLPGSVLVYKYVRK